MGFHQLTPSSLACGGLSAPGERKDGARCVGKDWFENFDMDAARAGEAIALPAFSYAAEGEAAVGEDLVVDGGAKMQRRKAGPNDISDAQIETFYVTLAETCNVVRSAKAAGFSTNWAYRKRLRDAGFRVGWARAVREGYAKLELVLLERAMRGTPKPFVGRDGSERTIREYSTALAVALLRRHAETAEEADYAHDGEEAQETRKRILEKLARMRARDEGQAAEGVETKGVVDRIATIRWALRRRLTLPPLSFPESPSAKGRGVR